MMPAPTCPDCGASCYHLLTLPVPCRDPDCNPCAIERHGCGCDGALDDGCFLCTPSRHKRPACAKVVLPPPPTDEQIFGRTCEQCRGRGERAWDAVDEEQYQLGAFDFPGSSSEEKKAKMAHAFRCTSCAGTGRVGAARNQWKCLGRKPRGYELRCAEGHPLYFKEEMDDTLRRGLVLDECHECPPGNDDRGTDGVYEVGPVCSGRLGIVADPETWAAAIRSWRTRTKTTEWAGYEVRRIVEGARDTCLMSSLLDLRTDVYLTHLLPDVPERKRGRWTIVVTFVPDFVPEDERA